MTQIIKHMDKSMWTCFYSIKTIMTDVRIWFYKWISIITCVFEYDAGDCTMRLTCIITYILIIIPYNISGSCCWSLMEAVMEAFDHQVSVSSNKHKYCRWTCPRWRWTDGYIQVLIQVLIQALFCDGSMLFILVFTKPSAVGSVWARSVRSHDEDRSVILVQLWPSPG